MRNLAVSSPFCRSHWLFVCKHSSDPSADRTNETLPSNYIPLANPVTRHETIVILCGYISGVSV